MYCSMESRISTSFSSLPVNVHSFPAWNSVFSVMPFSQAVVLHIFPFVSFKYSEDVYFL